MDENNNFRYGKPTFHKTQLCALISICLICVFSCFAILQLYAAYKNVFFYLCKEILPILAVGFMIVTGLCTFILRMIPERYYKYGAAVLFEIFLLIYVFLFCMRIPDTFVKSWAESRNLTIETDEARYKYQTGEKLFFNGKETAQKYVVTGFSFDDTSAWTSDYYTKMHFTLDKKPDDLTLELAYDIYTPPQRMLIYINGKEFKQLTVSEAGTQTLDIPADFIPSDDVKLEFIFPDAVSPASRGENEDVRLLALNMHSICLFSKDEEKKKKFDYQVGSLLSFGDSASIENYCVNGFSIEPQNVWTSGQNAEMCFNLIGEYKNLTLNFKYGVYSPPQRVNVFADKLSLGTFVAAENGEQIFDIPAECIQDGILDLRFEFPDAVSPASKGENEDIRLLALNMQELKIYEREE